ncbi:hypothetical protein DND132_1398 [Pseudodesulfovibrio mercurii]|uniref:Glucosyl transferase GtrII n=1 Tax=Pseudodesulfovibrio mercurii TaxID=641491 RepID=F0JDS4_9BACT|nr:glucosyltransferase domain-containing protein [Pseudodesulfovibrio mercurii]EGB14606.1 hypothetical protein DND132_1398 [Pseudodesulfovibrio mercurii]
MQCIKACRTLYDVLRDVVVRNYPTCIILTISWFLVFSTYIFSGRLYIDDIGRSIRNYDLWRTGGRPLADILSRSLYLSSSPFNISPISHLLFFAVMSFVGVIIVRMFNRKESLRNVIYIFPIGMSPFIIQIASYAFDSPWYAIGVLTATLSALTLTLETGFLAGVTLQVFFIGCSLCLYQPTFGVYVLLALLLMFNRLLLGKSIRGILSQTAVSSICALSLYKIILSFMPLAWYAENHKGLFGIRDLLSGFLVNTGQYISLLRSDWQGTPFGYLMLAFILLFLLGAFLYIGKDRPTRTPLYLVTLAIIPLCVLVIGGVQLLLAKPVWHYRVLVAGSVLVTALYFALPRISSRLLGNVLGVVVVLICIHSALYVSLYGYISKIQVQYETYILNHLVFDVDSCLDKYNDLASLDIQGTTGVSPALANVYGIYPTMKRLNPATLDGRSWWGYMQLQYYSRRVAGLAFEASTATSLPPAVVRTPYYSIYVADRELIIRFPEVPPPPAHE